MLKLLVKNLTKRVLNDPARDSFFACTGNGEFILRAAFYEDKLAYLVAQLHEKGKLAWRKDDSGDCVAEYRNLTIKIGSGSSNSSEDILLVSLDNEQGVISRSPLIGALQHDIWHILGVPHAHTSFDILNDYYSKQKKVAEKVIKILKSR